jgi:hypothetical protein
MNKMVISFGILLIALAFANPAFPMGGEHPAEVPMGQHPD